MKRKYVTKDEVKKIVNNQLLRIGLFILLTIGVGLTEFGLFFCKELAIFFGSVLVFCLWGAGVEMLFGGD